jgi:hypothetical protein
VDAWKAAIVQRDSGSSRLTIAEWVASLNRAWLVGSITACKSFSTGASFRDVSRFGARNIVLCIKPYAAFSY